MLSIRHTQFALMVADKLGLPILGDHRQDPTQPSFGSYSKRSAPLECSLTHPNTGLQIKSDLRKNLSKRYTIITHLSASPQSIRAAKEAIDRSFKRGKVKPPDPIISLVLYASSNA